MALPVTHSSLESGFQPSRTAPALDRSARSGPSKTLVKGLLGLVSLLLLLLVTVPGAAAATATDRSASTRVGAASNTSMSDAASVFDNTDKLRKETRIGPGTGQRGAVTTSYGDDANGNRSKVAVALNASQTLNRHTYTLNNPTTLSDHLGYDLVRVIDGTSATVSTPARASSLQIGVTHTAPKCAGDAKVGMSPEQLAINEACGNELAEANLQTKPEWLQDLVHGNQAFADKAWPLVALGIAGALGAAGTAGAQKRRNAKNGLKHGYTYHPREMPVTRARRASWMRDRTVNGNDSSKR